MHAANSKPMRPSNASLPRDDRRSGTAGRFRWPVLFTSLLECCDRGIMRISLFRIRHGIHLALLASFWKSCFAETIDKHLGLPMTGAGYIFRYSEIGLNLKDLGRRLPGFCISP